LLCILSKTFVPQSMMLGTIQEQQFAILTANTVAKEKTMSAQALKKFEKLAAEAQAKCDQFAEDFAKDPAHALGWSNSVFQAAARLKIAQMMVYAFTPREGEAVCTIKQARDTCLERVMNKARWPAQSTSPTSNLMEQYEAAAYAEALDELQHMDKIVEFD
jgi:hypothetical protein